MPPLFLISAALGGAAMYFFDPERGRSRRALMSVVQIGRGLRQHHRRSADQRVPADDRHERAERSDGPHEGRRTVPRQRATPR